MGIGLPHEEVIENTPNRFRDVANCMGLLGHRIEWAIKGLHLMCTLGPIIVQGIPTHDINDERRSFRYTRCCDTLSRIGHRACSFAREDPAKIGGADGVALWPSVKRGLRQLAAMVRSSHGKRARMLVWESGQGHEDFQLAGAMLMELESIQRKFAAERHRESRKALRKWVAHAERHVGHKATKTRETTLTLSASGAKGDLGQRTEQAAADAGGCGVQLYLGRFTS